MNLVLKNHLSRVRNSINSKMFRNFFISIDGQIRDVAEDGNLSCAIYVSNMLLMTGELIGSGHATIDSTIKDILKNDWYEIADPKTGCVLLWEEKEQQRGKHQHLGFYVDNNQAISHLDTDRVPTLHDWTFDGKRKIEKIFWHKALEE